MVTLMEFEAVAELPEDLKASDQSVVLGGLAARTSRSHVRGGALLCPTGTCGM